jgi:hypothetical protein
MSFTSSEPRSLCQRQMTLARSNHEHNLVSRLPCKMAHVDNIRKLLRASINSVRHTYDTFNSFSGVSQNAFFVSKFGYVSTAGNRDYESDKRESPFLANLVCPPSNLEGCINRTCARRTNSMHSCRVTLKCLLYTLLQF